MVKVIDIDLDRRRISLSLKQANEGMTVDTEFDPTRYGMAAEYDDQGNYIYPEGFDVDSGEWKDGFESQRETWEKEYAEAHSRYEQHIAQIRKAAEADAEAVDAPAATNYSTQGGGAPAVTGGSLASDEQLAALREKGGGGCAREPPHPARGPGAPGAVRVPGPASVTVRWRSVTEAACRLSRSRRLPYR